MSNVVDQANHSSELSEETRKHYESQVLDDIEHKTEITLCYVSGSEDGNRVYGLYIEDTENLRKPIGIEISVWPNESIHVQVADSALEMLSYLKPELLHQLEREEAEQSARKREAKKQRNKQ